MVTIVSGMRSGLELGSLQVLGLRENVGGALQGSNGQGVHVNVALGQVVVQDEDDLLVARGHDASLVRTYNSNGTLNDDNADGWSSGMTLLRLAGTVNAPGSTLQRVAADGSTATYEYDAARSVYVSAEGSGADDTIAYMVPQGFYEWRDGATGTTQRHEGYGAMRLLSSRDPSGNTVWYAYGANGFLSSITTANGETVWYDYAGNNLSQVRTTADGVTTTRVRYAYDTSNRLATVTVDLSPADNSVADGKVYQTTYTYDGTSKRIASIAQGNGTRVAFTYVDVGGGSYKVATVRDGLGQTTAFTYGVRFTTVTDALGFATRYDYDHAGQITGITGPAVAGVSATRQFAYDARGNVVSVTDGEGRTTTFQYDDRGNQVLQRDAAGNTVARTFDARNQLVAETGYTQPDPDGGGPVAPAGALVSRHVYDESGRHLLRFSISAEGRVTEHRYDGFGQRVATLTHVAGTYPPAGVAPDTAFTEAALASWVSMRMLLGTLRTDYTYDARGQLETKTTYALVGPDGVGVRDGSQSVERYVRDQAGRLLQTVSPANGTTSFTYDGLGRTVTTTNALGQVTVTQHDDAGRRMLVTSTGGLVTTSWFDAAGRLVTVAQSTTAGAALGETHYSYDALNRLRMTQDPTGVRSWILYDAAGRKAADIDGNGTMTEYAYDRRDLVVGITTWGTTVHPPVYVDETGSPVWYAPPEALRPAQSAADAGVWRQYDAAGRLVREATSTGIGMQAAVTEMRYDGASRLVQVVRYANPILTTAFAGNVGHGTVALPAASSQDRVTRHFHDGEGRLRGTLDAEGYLTTFRYDAAGQLVERLTYATPTPSGARATGTLDQLLPPASAADIRERTFHDSRGRVTTQLDGEGYATETVYDANGNAAQIIRYATALPASIEPAPGAPVRPPPSPADRSTLRAFDALNRLVQETSPEGLVTQYVYDTAGNLVSTVRAAGTGEVRTLLARYDVQGRLTGELSAEGAALLTGGQTQAQVDAIWAQHAVTHAYDAASRRVSTTNALGHRTLFFYDADGALTHTVNALGEVQESRYDARGRIVETVAYAGRIAPGAHSGGLVTDAFRSAVGAVANPTLDSRTTFTYTRDGRVASTTDAVGSMTTSTYNAFGEETSRQLSGAGVNQLETYTVDRRGQRTRVAKDPLGLNAITSASYDAFGRETSTTDANGQVHIRSYDRVGRVLVWRNPTGATRLATYDAFSRVLTETDELGKVTSYAYDAAARSLRVTTPEGISTTTFYTRHGQVERVVDGNLQTTTWVYDRNGNLVRTVLPIGSSSSTYDAAGRVKETWDANGMKVEYSYDEANRVRTRRVDPQGLDLTTRYEWNAKGQQVAVVDPNGVTTTIEYDRKGRVLKRTVDPDGLNLQTVSTYDARDKVLTVRSPGGSVTQYVYDALGRRTQEGVDPAGLNLQRSWTYDGNGNAVSSTDARGHTTRYAYDASDRLVFTVDPMGHVSERAYDAAGRLVKTVAYATRANVAPAPVVLTADQVRAAVPAQPAQDVVEHRVYDKDGRLAATVDGMGGVVRYGHDGKGNVTTRTAYANRIGLANWAPGTLPAPLADPAKDATVRTVYDGLDRAVYTIDGTGAVVANTYDNVGRVLQRIAYAAVVPPGTAATTSALGAAVALVANEARDAVVRNTYDAAGRLAWTVDGMGAVVQRAYDANGNVVRQVEYATPIPGGASASTVPAGTGDRSTTFAYDAANRLVFQVDALRGVTEQAYDADGHLTRRTSYAAPLDTVPTPGKSGTVGAIRSALFTTDPANRSTHYAWDAGGREAMVVDAMGAVKETQYDGAGNVLASTAYAAPIDPAALAAGATASSIKALVTLRPGIDRITRHAYDAAGREVYAVDAEGAVRFQQFDGAGRVLRTTRFAAKIQGTASTVEGVQAALRPDAAKDQVETFGYDAAGHLLSVTDALNGTESFVRDALGRKLEFVDKKGARWTYTYDAAGRTASETSPEVSLARAVADPATGRLTAMTVPNARVVTKLAYDALGNLTERTEAAGLAEERTSRYEYDALGRQVRVIHPPVPVYDAAADAPTTNGATGLASRTEKATALETRTFYDALGNAVASRDVAGSLNQKAYDVLGRVVYEIDALGYVTGYTRSSFGDVTSLVRYGAATTLATADVTQAAQAASRSQVEGALAAPGFDHSRDRTLLSSYDRMGRLVQKAEPEVFVHDANLDQSLVQYGKGRRTTQNVLDAFGQVVQVRVLRNAQANAWATDTYYFDRAGRETAKVDALGYLTARTYDAFGNVAESTEFATAVPPGWTVAGYTLPPRSADDRTTAFTYDRLNRKVAETRVQVEFSTASDGTSTRGNLVTSFGYDALGNQTEITDAAGKSTYTYYDALGRVTAIAAPTRRSTASGAPLTPLTTFRRDAHGNAVVTLEHVLGAASADKLAATAVGSDANDRLTVADFDKHGRVRQVMDAAESSQYFSYDAYGHVEKQWQAVTGNDGVTRTSFEISVYDKLGRVVQTRTPASVAQSPAGGGVVVVSQATAGIVVNTTEYNAFGEVTRKGTQGLEGAEYFDYDNAGRLWRTNAGDGVDRIHLYNLQGHLTAEIRSAGSARDNIDVKALPSAEAASANPSTRRVDFQVDLLGRVTAKQESARQELQGGVGVSHQFTTASAQVVIGAPVPVWAGRNRVPLTWNSLAALGSGDIRVTVEYRSKVVEYWDELAQANAYKGGNLQTYRSGVIVGDASASGTTLEWDVPFVSDQQVDVVTRITVEKKDKTGQWQRVIDQPPGHGTNSITVQAPPDPNATLQMQVRAAGSAGDTGWWTAGLVDFGGGYRFDASGLAAGNYEYRIRVTDATDPSSTRVTAMGTVGISLPPLNNIDGLHFGHRSVVSGVMSWPHPGNNYVQVFRYRPSGSTGAWSTLPVTVVDASTMVWQPGVFIGTVDTRALPPGAYQFELLWTLQGQNAPSSHATGYFNVVAPIPSVWVPPVNLPPIQGVAVNPPPWFMPSIGCTIGWPAVNANSAQYRVPGGAWNNFALDSTGQSFETGVPTGVQMVYLKDLPPGTYEIRITAGSPPSMQATGTLTIHAPTPGYWTTIYVQVSYSVPVYNEFGEIIGYTTTIRTEPRSQWVPPVTYTPTLAITTPPYVLGYYTQPVPTQYGVTVTTQPGSAAISSLDGSVIGQSAWMNGDSRWQRPTVLQKTDRWGNVIEITDPRAAYWKTTYRYNANNQLVQQVLPDAGRGPGSSFLYYDRLGRQVATRDANGNVNGQVFDEGGNLVREHRADGGVAYHGYDAFANKVITIDAMSKTVRYEYDKLDRLKKVDRGTASVWSAGDTAAVLAGTRMLSDRWTYDQLGRKLSHTNGNGETTLYSYDLAGNMVATRQPLGQEVRTTYDAHGRKTAETDANGTTARWTYDYFGLLRGHMDLGGASFSYAYDNARQLISQTSQRGQSLTYGYDAAGQLTSIRDWASDKTTTYVYDLAGRKLRERVVQAGITYQDNRISYDGRGHLRAVADGRAHVQIEYDQVGNRTRVLTFVDYQGVEGEQASQTDRYFKYDAMNRQVVVDAVDAAGNRGQRGHEIVYDKNGNRVSDKFWGTRITATDGSAVTSFDQFGLGLFPNLFVGFVETPGDVIEQYRYDDLNRLESVLRDGMQIDLRRYDGADRVVQSGPGAALPQKYVELINKGLSPEQMNGHEARVNAYDANGRLLRQTVLKSDVTRKMDLHFDATRDVSGWGSTFRPEGYDAAGNALGYVVVNHEGGYMNESNTTLVRFDGYQSQGTSAWSTKLRPGTTTQNYDANGHLVGVVDSTQSANNRTLVNDASGRALYVIQAGRVQRQLVVNGEVLGLYGAGVDPAKPATGYDNVPNFANVVDFDFGYAPVSAKYPTPSPGAYAVRSGDTLQSIAQGAYGDGALWFRIAEANGLASNSDLRVGQTLNIPNRVSTIHNNSTTFKPYDPSRMEGDTSPSLAMPKPKKKGGWFGKLLAAVVAVAVTVVTGGALGAAMGSIASQGVAIAAGVQDKFSWKAVGLSALSAGITSGLSIGGILPGIDPMSVAARSAVSNVVTQGIGVATGLADKFEWRGVAASGVGAFVGEAVGARTGSDFGGRVLASFAAGTAAAVVRGGRVVVQQVAVDAFGNALGQSLAENANGVVPAASTPFPAIGDTGEHVVYGKPGPQPNWVTTPEVDPTLASAFAPYGNGAETDESWVLAANGGYSLSGKGPRVNTAAMGAGAEMWSGKDRLRQFEIEQRNESGRRGLPADDLPFSPSSSVVQGTGPTITPSAAAPTRNVFPRIESGYFTEKFKSHALNSDVPIVERQLWGATLPLVLLEQGGIGLINAPGNFVRTLDNALSVFTAPTTEDRVIAGLWAVKYGAETALGLAPLVPASKWTNAITFGRTGPAVQTEVVLAGSAADFKANFVGPTFGRSGFTSTRELGEVSYVRYQRYVDDAYDAAVLAESRGLLKGNPNTRIGTAVDRESAIRFTNWLASEQIPEGVRGMVQANRWLRDPTGTGLYVRPDIRIPGAHVSLDATVGLKWSTDIQITRFGTFSGGDRITIVRPAKLGGSYSIWP